MLREKDSKQQSSSGEFLKLESTELLSSSHFLNCFLEKWSGSIINSGSCSKMKFFNIYGTFIHLWNIHFIHIE